MDLRIAEKLTNLVGRKASIFKEMGCTFTINIYNPVEVEVVAPCETLEFLNIYRKWVPDLKDDWSELVNSLVAFERTHSTSVKFRYVGYSKRMVEELRDSLMEKYTLEGGYIEGRARFTSIFSEEYIPTMILFNEGPLMDRKTFYEFVGDCPWWALSGFKDVRSAIVLTPHSSYSTEEKKKQWVESLRNA